MNQNNNNNSKQHIVMIHCSNPYCGLSVMEYDNTNNDLSKSNISCKICGWELTE